MVTKINMKNHYWQNMFLLFVRILLVFVTKKGYSENVLLVNTLE